MSEIWLAVQEIYHALHSGGLPDMGVWSYVILGLLVATEGPLSTLLGAAAAAAGMAEMRWVLLAAILGNVVGDCAWYSVGYLGKSDSLKRYGRYVGVKPCHIDRLQGGMQVHALKLIVFSKLAYGLIVPTLVAAGVARVPFRKWFPVVFVVETLWSLLLVYVGYHATWFLVDFERGLRTVGVVGLLALLGVIAFVVYRRKRAAIAALPALASLPRVLTRRPWPVSAESVAKWANPRAKGSPMQPMVQIAHAPILLIGESLIGETIDLRMAEAAQVLGSVSVESVGVLLARLEVEPVEGSG